MRNSRRVVALVAALLPWSLPAHAHHVMGGALPSAWWEGLLSGLGHPLIGPDHLAFLVAAALLAAARPRALLMLSGLVLASLAGVLVHLSFVMVPAVEPIVATTVVLAGLALLAMRPVSDGLFAALLIVAGLFHGYAFGQNIVGAEPSPIFAYLFGLALIQFAVMWGVVSVARILSMPAARPLAYRGIGAVVALGGVILLGQALA